MKHLSSIVLAVALIAAGATACFKDPTSSLRNGPSRIELSRSSLFVNVGDSISVQAEVKDDAGNTFDAADAVWTSSVPAIIAVNKAAATVPFDAFSRAFVKAVAPGLSWVFITTHGLTDSVQVYGLPANFSGAVTVATGSMMGDTITVAGTSVLAFTSATTVTIGGSEAFIISQTASQLKVMASQPAAGGSAVVLTGLKMLGVVDIAELTATTALGVASTVRANGYSPDNQAPATAPAFTIPALYTSPIIGVADPAVSDTYWKFTTPAGTTGDSVEISVEWKTDADLDIGIVNTAGACISGQLPGSCFATMGTGADPEIGKWRLAAGTSYLVDVNVFDAGSAPLIAFKISFRRLAAGT